MAGAAREHQHQSVPPPKADKAARQRAAWRSAARAGIVASCVVLGFGAVAAQLVRLASQNEPGARIAAAAPIAESYSRPDILDRDGRRLATDILLPTITANPSKILSVRETLDALATVLPPHMMAPLPERLSNRKSQFAWIARKISTARAKRVLDLGLPAIDFRWETKRTYPAGSLAGHVLGGVNLKNRGIGGLERYIDETTGLRLSRETLGDGRAPLRTTLSLAVQHAVDDELTQAMQTYEASAASGIVLDVDTGEILALSSLPAVDPAFPERWVHDGPIDFATYGRYELGSVFKAFTVAHALEALEVNVASRIDAHVPIQIGRTKFADKKRRSGPITIADVFTQSSNVGAGRLALAIGAEAQRNWFSKVGLLGPMKTEAGSIRPPSVPAHWGDVETVTVSFGHGLAVAPLQFAAAAAALVNGGYAVSPTLNADRQLDPQLRRRVLSAETSKSMRELFRENVLHGTAKRARLAGYDVGGKTGTADMATDGGYDRTRVITSFVAAFPMRAPRYLVFTTLHDPKPVQAAGNERVAGVNVVPATGRLIARIAPLLGVLPQPD
jgi:cell division protein FtsI (penicillin-binding protein 3)